MRNMVINPNADIAVYNRWMKEMVRYLHANNVPFMVLILQLAIYHLVKACIKSLSYWWKVDFQMNMHMCCYHQPSNIFRSRRRDWTNKSRVQC